MKKLHVLGLSILVVLLSACSTKDYNRFNKNVEEETVVKELSDRQYNSEALFEWKIRKGDRVEITAFNQSSTGSGTLSQLLSTGGQRNDTNRVGDEGMLILSSGQVNLPLVGLVKISGLTETEAAEKLIKEYKKYLRNPYVAVKILNQRLFVLGEVRSPGTLLVTNGTMTLFEALASSGDITDQAKRTNIKIIRGSLRNPEIREVDLTDLNSIRYNSLILQPNDIVYVDARDAKGSNVAIAEEMPLLQLISAILNPFTQAAIINDGFDLNN
ncbi:MAG: polysaccharide biosynthesis/export family protein [Campylobacterota bacterium]|nr:polysaccharide biosynthesis/export family protein [Campylobacterota bacterium]